MRVSLRPSFSLNIVALVLSVKFAAAQSSTASFIYPTPGTSPASQLTINLFDFIQFEWTSNYEKAFLYIWCDNGKGDGIVDKCMLHLYEVTNSSPSLNDVCATNGMHSQGLYREIDTNGRLKYSPSEQSDYHRNWTTLARCNCDISYVPGNNTGARGPVFSMSSETGKAITVFDKAYTSTEGIQVITIPGNSAPQNTPSASSTNSASRSDEATSNSLSGGAMAGIVIGAVFGAAVVVALCLLLLRNRRKIKSLETTISQLPAQEGGPSLRELAGPSAEKHRRSHPILQELDGHETQELPTLR